MDNSKLLNNAIGMLTEINADDTETVEITTTRYDDDSKMLTINIAFPAPEDDTAERK